MWGLWGIRWRERRNIAGCSVPACLLNKTSACGWAGSDQCIISVACSTFTVLCSYHLYLVPEHFVPQMKPWIYYQSLLISHPPAPGNSNLLLVTMDLTALRASHKRNHIGFVILCLAYFPEHVVLKVHRCCCHLTLSCNKICQYSEERATVWERVLFM